MGTLLEINGRVFEINNRENEIMKGWRKKRRMKPKPEPEPEQHEYVDLGLPSGTLWATENIKDGNGNELYFAWGDIKGYTSGQVGTDKYFSWTGSNADYKYGTYNDSDEVNWGMEKYNKTDGKSELDAEDDAATANWGEGWRMPTEEEFEELTTGTTTAYTQVDGVNGVLFTSNVNNNTLFFPSVGYAADGIVYKDRGHSIYWSVSLVDDGVNDAWSLFINDGYCDVSNEYRCNGFSVRPVHK